MKKLISGAIIGMAVTLVIGLSWGKLFKKGYTQEEYGVEIEKRDQKIAELEDSISSMRFKLEFYNDAIKWAREAGDEELWGAINMLRKVPKDVPLP